MNNLGCRDGAVVRALASHRCGPGLIPRSGIMCGLSFVGSLLCTERFSPGTPVFPLLKNQHLTWFLFIVNFSKSYNTVESQRKYRRSLDISLNEIFKTLSLASEDFVYKIQSPNCFASYEAYIFNEVYRFMVLAPPDLQNLVCKTVLFPYTDGSSFLNLGLLD